MTLARRLLTLIVILRLVGAPALACTGDCNADAVVTVDEIMRGVAIVLGSRPLAECAAFDEERTGTVTVDKLVTAVARLLGGCPTMTPTPAATPTPSPTAHTPADPCVVANCMPEGGCVWEPRAIDEPCCTGALVAFTPEPQLDCPQGRTLALGAGSIGFGHLTNCQKLRIYSSLQAGTFFRIHLEARCIDPREAVLNVRLETASTVLSEGQENIDLADRGDGYLESRSLIFPIRILSLPTSLEGREAQIHARLIDRNGEQVERIVRVLLTLVPVSDR